MPIPYTKYKTLCHELLFFRSVFISRSFDMSCWASEMVCSITLVKGCHVSKQTKNYAGRKQPGRWPAPHLPWGMYNRSRAQIYSNKYQSTFQYHKGMLISMLCYVGMKQYLSKITSVASKHLSTIHRGQVLPQHCLA